MFGASPEDGREGLLVRSQVPVLKELLQIGCLDHLLSAANVVEYQL